MSSRKRVRNIFPVVQGGGGGGPSAGGTIQWGPTFGEGDGEQAVSAGIDLSALALQGNVGAGAAPKVSALAVDYDVLGGGAALTGEAEGAPFHLATSTATQQTGSTSNVINKPAGTKDGDLLLAFVGNSVGTTSSTNQLTPSGWTSVTSVNFSKTRLHCFYKVAGASEPATYTFSTAIAPTYHLGEIHRLVGVNTSSPIDASITSTVSQSDLDPDPNIPNLNTTQANTMVFISVYHDHLALSQSHTPPASHTEVSDFQESTPLGTDYSAITTSYRIFASAGATGTAEVNCSQLTGGHASIIRVAIAPGPVTLA